MNTHAAVDGQGRVLRLVPTAADAAPLTAVLLPEPMLHWPIPPAAGLELRWVSGALQWHDPRPRGERARAVRAERDRRIQACDWLALRALEQQEPVPLAWRQYRQALRDVPDQAGFPDTVAWPAEPS